MRIIGHEKIKNIGMNYLDYYNWAKEVFFDKKNCTLPPKISMKQENHSFINVMPSIINNLNVAGVKVVTRYVERKPSLDSQILLYDAQTGENLALMDANIITAYRTGAVAALSINVLAKEDYQTIAVIGLGNVCYATFNILLKTINRNINIKVMSFQGEEEEFINRYKQFTNLRFEIVNNYEDLIKDSDVIVSCVTSTDINFGKDEWFKEGCLVVPVHTMGFQNCDLFFDKFIVDDIGHVSGFKYFKEFKEVHEMADVLENHTLGRTSNSERIIAYNVGNSIFDIYFAKKIYDLLNNEYVETINLEKPQEKLWI